jgi:GNAT superfamily N-acetyltransferase
VTLEEGRFDIAPGHLAVVVTHLICRAPAALPARPCGIELRVEDRIAPEAYRALFRMVGRNWLWTSRLHLGDDALVSALGDPAVALYTVRADGAARGMVELDLGRSAVPRISFFGLAPGVSGRGIGRWLMAHFQSMLFDDGAEAITLDTCTLDSPGALRFYLRNGFEAERREVRVFRDPRALGLLDAGAAPFVPRL